MNDAGQLLPRLNEALPLCRSWVSWVLAENHPIAKTVDSLGFRRIEGCFPESFITDVRVVITGRLPFPPVVKYGLTQFAHLESIPKAGITFANMVFIHESMVSESVLFHELVHALQWKTLGVDVLPEFAHWAADGGPLMIPSRLSRWSITSGRIRFTLSIRTDTCWKSRLTITTTPTR